MFVVLWWLGFGASEHTWLARAAPPLAGGACDLTNQHRRGEGRGRSAEPAAPPARVLGDAATRRGDGAERSGSTASLPSPPFAVFNLSAGPELCDPGSSGAIAVWDKQ